MGQSKTFNTLEELTLQAEGNGIFFAKKGAMIAAQGTFQYRKRLIRTNKRKYGQSII
ncbi:hypothetical protein WAX46_12670 [Bacillus sp. FJAT-53060]|uniref:hypothetical protein n=1 Tax=Bacillus TaxID=1386 RepID=UPI001CFC39FD|nr:hypothetical protein [Bacillus stratosphericus]